MDSINKKIIIIGSGFSSLAASCYLAKMGYDVTILEKNNHIGGRAQQLKKDEFKFDMGPTFYWMPDVFEKFFADFGKKPNDYYELIKLDPGYRIYHNQSNYIDISANFDNILKSFDTIEKGSGKQLKKFIDNAENNYNLAIKNLVYQPGESILEIINVKTLLKLPLFFNNIKSLVARFIKNKSLKQILEFPVLFLGAKPDNTPGFYNFMNYADLKLGTWHPIGGMQNVALGMKNLAEELGVKILLNQNIESFELNGNNIAEVNTKDCAFPCDILLSGADYHFTESLLPKKFRQYSEKYWSRKTFAPSALLFYVGFDTKIKNVQHHTLFFDTDFEEHAKAIYDTKTWPKDPLFYASFPSISDQSFARNGYEAATFLIPISPGINDEPAVREKYFELIINRLEKITNQSLANHVIVKESYCVQDFIKQFNSYKGNAYGLANTLLQTHVLRPKLHSKKISNLFFTGQLTVPGPGVPPAIISGNIVSKLIEKKYKL